MNNSNQEKVVKTESDVQVQNINPLVMEKRKMENLSKETNSVSGSMHVNRSALETFFAQSRINDLKDIDLYLFYKIGFRKKQNAVRFSKWADKPANGLGDVYFSKDGKGYAVSFRGLRLLKMAPGNIQRHIDKITPMSDKFGSTSFVTKVVIRTRNIGSERLDSFPVTEGDILRDVKTADSEKHLHDWITYKSVFSSEQDVLQFGEWCAKKSDGIQIADITENDEGYIFHYSLFENNLSDDFIDFSLRAIRKASTFGGKYLGWSAFTCMFDACTNPEVIH